MDFLFPSDELMLEDIFDFELRFSVDKFRKGGVQLVSRTLA